MAKFLILFLLVVPSFVLANVRGSDLQNFNPNYNGLDFVTVLPSQTLEPLQLNFGGFLNYTTNSLAYSTVSGAPNTQKLTEPNDTLLYSNLQIGLGIMKGWDIGFGAGFVNAQDVQQSNFLFSYADTGLNDILISSKVRLINENNWGLAFVAGVDFEQIKNNPFAGDNAGPSFNLEGVIDFKITPNLLWALNLGYRLRQQGTPIPNTGVTPLSDQIIYSSALSYQTSASGSAFMGELFGSYPTQALSLPTDRQISNLEFLLSYRWRATNAFDFLSGLGTEAYQGLGTPDIRAFIGFNLRYDFLQQASSNNSTSEFQGYKQKKLPERANTYTENDSDQDGVPDNIDQCPNTWAQNYVDERGCPVNSNDFPEE